MEIGNRKTGASRNQGWHLVRVAVAGLLLTASALKCWQLATEPVIGISLLESRWLLMATVEFELLFAIWLLANIWAKPTWAAALACFGLFTCVSVCKVLSGHASCGCFGRISVSPWYTGGLDLAILASLLRWRPKESCFTIQRATVVLVIWLLVGVPAAFVMGSYTNAKLSDAGKIIGDGKVVVIEPEKWIGKRFPLLPYIEDIPGTLKSGQPLLRKRLTEGEWIVMLYHYDCPKCLEEIPRYEALAHCSAADDLTVPQVLLVEVPPYSDGQAVGLSPDTPCALGRLSNKNEWFVETPAVFRIRNHIVQSKWIGGERMGQ